MKTLAPSQDSCGAAPAAQVLILLSVALTVAEFQEPIATLRPMTAGGEVVEDYGHVGLTLRDHPVSFLRGDLRRRRIVTCREAMQARDGQWLEAAGLVLVRQRPGSAKGVMFITLKDETGIANLVVWVKVFEKYRRIVLSAGMIGVYGRIQREGEVVHLVPSAERPVGRAGQRRHRNESFPLPHGRGDEFHHGSSTPDPRGLPNGPKPRNIYDPYGHIDQIKGEDAGFQVATWKRQRPSSTPTSMPSTPRLSSCLIPVCGQTDRGWRRRGACRLLSGQGLRRSRRHDQCRLPLARVMTT